MPRCVWRSAVPEPSITVDPAVLGATGETELMLMRAWRLGPVTHPTGELVAPLGEAAGILGGGSCRYVATALR